TGIEQRLPLYSVYWRTVAGKPSSDTLSRLMYWPRSSQAPLAQNLPTMSVEYDRPTSGPCPAPMAWVIFESSWPDLTITLIFGWLALKSATTLSIAWASRSVKKCQNSTVPDTSVPGSATFVLAGAGVEAAATARTTAAITGTRHRRSIVDSFDFGQAGAGWGCRLHSEIRQVGEGW